MAVCPRVRNSDTVPVPVSPVTVTPRYVPVPVLHPTGGKRKATEISSEAPTSSFLIPSFDTHPHKKLSSSSLISQLDSPAISALFSVPPSHPPSSSSVFSDGNSLVRMELNRVSQQLSASREDLARERQGRDADRLLFEQEIALLKAENERLIAEKGKGRG